MDRAWRVVVRGPVSDEELAALPGDQMLFVSGHTAGGQLESSTIWVRASDPVAAERAVRSHISEPRVLLPPTPLPYVVSVSVPEQDAEPLGRVLSERRRQTGSIGPVITTEPTDGFAQLMLDAIAETDEEAIDQAREAYAALRTEAQLPPADPTYLNLHRPWQPDQQQHRDLLDRAHRLLEAGMPDLAVVVAQTAVEVLVKRMIDERLQAREIGSLRAYIIRIRLSLQDPQSQRLWTELTRDNINQAAAWPRYPGHVDRRNSVVHEGADVGEPDARMSLAVAQAVIEHIETLPPVTEID